ncbi:MAG TPA: hypothetical protein DC047_05355 [Blastocatellia bacterium]|nr:hypothetical protein [Blastocatellia bacterium]
MKAFDSLDQFQRVTRCLRKITEIALRPGNNLVIGDPEPMDLYRAFFIECQNLKDYLKKDSRISDAKMVESFIDNSPMLKLCVDIGNSFKHAGLDNKPRSGMRLAKVNYAYSINLPPIQRDATIGTEILVTFDNRQYKALEIATRCVSEWRKFMTAAKML